MKKYITEKVFVAVAVGTMQLSLGINAFAATVPTTDAQTTYLQQINETVNQKMDVREQERQRLVEQENQRHREAMKQRPNESEEDWQDRQMEENERHEVELQKIFHNTNK